jgi:hypothetical protein
MSSKQSQAINDFTVFFEAAFLDLPTAAARRMMLAEDGDQELRAAGWKAYDAFVRLANESANQLYANPLFGTATANTLEFGLQARRVSNALVSAWFRDILPVTGLPTSKEVERLNRSVEALRDEVRAMRLAQEAIEPETDDYATIDSAEAQNPSAQIVWNGLKSETSKRGRRAKKSVTL